MSSSLSLKQMIANASILLLCCLCIAYAGLNFFAAICANNMIFPAPPSSYTDDDHILKLKAGDGESISAYFLKAESSDRLLIYSHGNGEDIGQIRPLLQYFQQLGTSILAYDYPSYGTSTGQKSESGTYSAIMCAYKYATETLGYPPQKITLYGRSLGSGPSTWLAEREIVAGLILDGAFTSTFRVMTGIKLLAWDKFDNYARLPNIKCPILIIHGTDDKVVPFTHAQSNWMRIEGAKFKLFVQGAGHGDLVENAGDDYWNIVRPFILGELQ
ncbi:MAG: alpha/beta fold hydrolase [Verrucomicrobiota bacterium]|nr:alpha/beta fold hydrolase [Verrucomicrobiota bacterium]